VRSAVAARWGAAEAALYDPYSNARTFRQWLTLGCRVKKGEKGIRSITFIEVKNAEGKGTVAKLLIYPHKKLMPRMVE
jgi:antirestriction protein ArdC